MLVKMEWWRVGNVKLGLNDSIQCHKYRNKQTAYSCTCTLGPSNGLKHQVQDNYLLYRRDIHIFCIYQNLSCIRIFTFETFQPIKLFVLIDHWKTPNYSKAPFYYDWTKTIRYRIFRTCKINITNISLERIPTRKVLK